MCFVLVFSGFFGGFIFVVLVCCYCFVLFCVFCVVCGCFGVYVLVFSWWFLHGFLLFSWVFPGFFYPVMGGGEGVVVGWW